MAPRLTQRERVRVLVHALKDEPDEELWEMLRDERPEPGTALPPEDALDTELLDYWALWLSEHAKALIPSE